MDTTALSEQRTEQRFFAQGRGDDRGHQWSVRLVASLTAAAS
jgi:hypothetical protein